MSLGAGRFLEQDLSTFEKTMQLNYFGALRIIKEVLPAMVFRQSGEIVLVSSAAAVCGDTALPWSFWSLVISQSLGIKRSRVSSHMHDAGAVTAIQ